MLILIAYSNAPGPMGSTPDRWPPAVAAVTNAGKDSLVMFVHPHCPCSRSAIHELARLMACCPEQIAARVYFYRPANAPGGWEQTDLWKAALRIPGVVAIADPEGEMAAQFGAQTSGLVLLYRADGRLAFRGGITAGRGHEGDNAGRDAVIAMVHDLPFRRNTNPVFGCRISEADRIEPGREESCPQ
jgi:hypothetical protein